MAKEVGSDHCERVEVKMEEDENMVDSTVLHGNPGNLTVKVEGSPSNMRDDLDDNVIMIRMDIKEPLSTIKRILEEKVEGISEFKFTLQGSEELDGNMNLLEHCVQGEGLVQINLVLKYEDSGNTIDIMDVLKPEDEDDLDDEETNQSGEEKKIDGDLEDQQIRTPKGDGAANDKPHQMADNNQAYIPQEFNGGMNDSTSGDAMPKRTRKPPRARKKNPATNIKGQKAKKVEPPKMKTTALGRSLRQASPVLQMANPSASQVQLWQFLLELLTNYAHRDSIQWLEREGEFKLINPEMVAKLWGLRKNKPHMTYEKLSRALRYYYDGDMISKVPGQRFVYKFICDLKFMIGYTASELNAFVIEAETFANKRCSIQFMYDDIRSPLSPVENKDNTEVRHGVVLASDFNLD